MLRSVCIIKLHLDCFNNILEMLSMFSEYDMTNNTESLMFLPVTSILVRSLHPFVRKTNEQTQRGVSLQSTGRVRRVICFVHDVPTGGRRDGAAVCTVASQQEPQARVEFACPPRVCERVLSGFSRFL